MAVFNKYSRECQCALKHTAPYRNHCPNLQKGKLRLSHVEGSLRIPQGSHILTGTWSRLKNSPPPKKNSHIKFGPAEFVIWFRKRAFADVAKLRILKQDYPGLSM